jgi:hypothetical protein
MGRKQADSQPLSQRTRYLSNGMTLVELLVFISMVVCAFIGAGLGIKSITGWYGGIIGGVLGFLTPVFCGFALALLMDSWKGTPPLPKCRNGCCHGPGTFFGDGDYDIQQDGEEFYRVCKCNDRYQRRGKRFVLINEDGTETPYLVWHRFRGWFDDNTGLKRKAKKNVN